MGTEESNIILANEVSMLSDENFKSIIVKDSKLFVHIDRKLKQGTIPENQRTFKCDKVIDDNCTAQCIGLDDKGHFYWIDENKDKNKKECGDGILRMGMVENGKLHKLKNVMSGFYVRDLAINNGKLFAITEDRKLKTVEIQNSGEVINETEIRGCFDYNYIAADGDSIFCVKDNMIKRYRISSGNAELVNQWVFESDVLCIDANKGKIYWSAKNHPVTIYSLNYKP